MNDRNHNHQRCLRRRASRIDGLSMPFQRALNPISKTNWEGVGVEPDVKVPADAALDKAVELARAAIGKD